MTVTDEQRKEIEERLDRHAHNIARVIISRSDAPMNEEHVEIVAKYDILPAFWRIYDEGRKAGLREAREIALNDHEQLTRSVRITSESGQNIAKRIQEALEREEGQRGS